MGRFMTPDPARSGLNWYAYAGGDPVNNSDPSGLESSAICGTSANAPNMDLSLRIMICGAGTGANSGGINNSLGAAVSGGIACPSCGGAAQTFWDPSSPFYDGGDGSNGPGLFDLIKSGFKGIGKFLGGGYLPPSGDTQVGVTLYDDDGNPLSTTEYAPRINPNTPVLRGEIVVGPGGIIEGGGRIAGEISGYTWHGLQQVISRPGGGVSARAILDAVRNPTSIVRQIVRGTTRFTGRDANFE
jgi:hypothetical protein